MCFLKEGDPMIETTNAKMCKKCGSTDSNVYESRQMMDYNNHVYVTRRRKCNNCGYKWKTVEIHYWDYINLIEGK